MTKIISFDMDGTVIDPEFTEATGLEKYFSRIFSATSDFGLVGLKED